jgi:signal transduction histidine kinase
VRLLATPVRAQDQQVVIVVGSSLGERDRALARLRSLMLIGGPVALVLAALAGYGLAAAALRPVDAMRRRAAVLSASTPGGRLPVPRNSDELARLGTTLNGLLARLEEALARERRFVADASHELMTPLALLQTELELASGRPPEELPGVVRSAGDETKALTRLARDLLVLARSDSGQLPVERASIDVEALFRRVASRSVAADAGTPSIDIDVPEGMVIEADHHRLEQALGNLVDNALRHGGGDVNLSARAEDGTVELHVTDEGPGIPEAFLGQAFERFSRADGAHRQGAGLGLAIAMTIAEAHGGTANAANRPGGGTDVWLSLPVRWSQPVAAHHVADRGEVGRPAAS